MEAQSQKGALAQITIKIFFLRKDNDKKNWYGLAQMTINKGLFPF